MAFPYATSPIVDQLTSQHSQQIPFKRFTCPNGLTHASSFPPQSIPAIPFNSQSSSHATSAATWQGDQSNSQTNHLEWSNVSKTTLKLNHSSLIHSSHSNSTLEPS
ncbi:hypothetical protein KFK09_001413 [Dendrobium nobile]|uniref:Uncharacterized protein n=1 Tax=Dendrobium nobile TaxID=94219 RepID=A0A8T3C4X0_DENNO|nr:hypothetical protein KFK09_001413 [Dendrobium nobile]